MALFGTLGTFLITALGAAGIFFVRREVSGNLQCGFLGFAGGSYDSCVRVVAAASGD